MITGLHALVFSRHDDRDRAFFGDTLGLDSVDAGGGWLIFALPPAELAVHPTEGEEHAEPYLMCDDVEATVAELTAKGAEFAEGVAERDWGRLTYVRLPGGGRIGLYEPKHPTAI